MTINQLIKLYEDLYKDYVEQFIHENFPLNKFTEPVYYYLEREKIKFRSGLPILINQMFRGKVENVIPVSAASEIIYAITLAQDDIIDGDEIRWGLSTSWKKYGAGMTLASADYSYYFVIKILKRIPNSLLNKRKIIDSFIDSHKKLYLSVMMEINNKKNFKIDIKDVLKIYEFKTMTGINATYCGALSVDGLPNKIYKIIRNYARWLAYSAQIRDDIKDIEVYNTKSSDIINGYMTYPIVKLKSSLNYSDFEIFKSNFGVNSDDAVDRILSLLKKYNVKSQCVKDINNFVYKAFSEIDKIKKLGYDNVEILKVWGTFYKM
jgi:geranylgeranyl pyrophosphate synthase